MKFLLDESAEFRIATFLREQGHDVTVIAHDYRATRTDREVLGIARSEERILITNDTDFGELVFRDHLEHHGVILFRIPSGDTPRKIEALRRALVLHAHDLHKFVVLDRRGVRIRG